MKVSGPVNELFSEVVINLKMIWLIKLRVNLFSTAVGM